MKNSGKGSKKVQRKFRAIQRQQEFEALSPQQQEAQKVQNKAAYDAKKSTG